MEKKLCLSSSHKWIGGVCGGIADYFGINSLIVRILFILLGLLGIGIIGWLFVVLYIVLWIALPKPISADVQVDPITSQEKDKQSYVVSEEPIDDRVLHDGMDESSITPQESIDNRNIQERPSLETNTDVDTFFDDNDFSDLVSIDIPEGVTSIPKDAFSSCHALTSVTIPNSVNSIGENAFQYCCGLTSITIPNSVTNIGVDAFAGCWSLTSIIIPNSVTNIGNNVFFGCSCLTSIKVENGNSKYDSRNNCNAIIETASNTLIAGCQNTVIPNSVTSIGSYAFGGCRNLTSITIPDSVTSIGSYAFDSCYGLTSITIPNSVTSIGNSAFQYCSGLTSITIPNSVTSIGNSTFSECI